MLRKCTNKIPQCIVVCDGMCAVRDIIDDAEARFQNGEIPIDTFSLILKYFYDQDSSRKILINALNNNLLSEHAAKFVAMIEILEK